MHKTIATFGWQVVMLAFESASAGATELKDKRKFCLHINNIAQQLQKRVWQISTLFSSSKQACSLQDQVCICCWSSSKWSLALNRGALQHSAAQKEESQKEPWKGWFFWSPFFGVLKAAMCLFCCKMHLLHSIDVQWSMKFSSPQHAWRVRTFPNWTQKSNMVDHMRWAATLLWLFPMTDVSCTTQHHS